MSDCFVLLDSVDPTMPMTTAAVRARRIICLFEVIREIGVFTTDPLKISLYDGSQSLNSFIKMTLKK